MSDQKKRSTLFKLDVGDGKVWDLAVDGHRNILFFTVRQNAFSPSTLYKSEAEKAVVRVDIDHSKNLYLCLVNSIHGTLYCIMVPRHVHSIRTGLKRKLTEITYNGSVVTRYTLPKDALTTIGFDKYENNIYLACEKEGTAYSNLYQLRVGSSLEFRLALVVETYTTLLLVSENSIYALGHGGYIFSKDMKLDGNITGGCHDFPTSGFVLR